MAVISYLILTLSFKMENSRKIKIREKIIKVG